MLTDFLRGAGNRAVGSNDSAVPTRSDTTMFTSPPLDLFPAKLTGYSSGLLSYSWTEQWFDTSGNRVDKFGGRTGTASWLPAKSPGGVVFNVFPVPVTLIRTIQTDTYSVVYEILGVDDLQSQCNGPMSDISGWNGSVVQILGHNTSGCLVWYSVEAC